MTLAVGSVTVRWRGFPADVVLPDRARPWHQVYVLVTDMEIGVWQRKSDTADWASPIQWARTELPGTDREARRGFDVHTTAGLVVVTLGAGCRCGPLGKWAGPVWASTERARG